MRTLTTFLLRPSVAKNPTLGAPTLALALLGLMAGLSLCCSDATAQQQGNQATSVEVVTTVRSMTARHASLVGHIKPWKQAVLYSKVAGYLESIAVDLGSWVREGDILAKVDNPELRSDFVRLRADSEAKRAIYDRLAKAQKSNPDMVSALEVDRAMGESQSAEAELERLRHLVSFTQIKAPYNGVITDRWVDPGALIQMATASQTPSARIVRIMNFDTVRVVIPVPETDCPYLTQGQKTVVRVPELPGKEFSGKVARFAWAIDPATRSMEAEIDIPNPDHRMRPGMYATVEIELDEPAETLRLPSETISIEGDKRFVWTVEDGRTRRVEVTIKLDNGIEAEVASGLTGSESVVRTGQQGLSEGAAVEIVETARIPNN